MTSQTTTAERLATQPEVLPTNRIALLGVTGGAGTRRALLRLPDGTVETVTEGDSVGAATVYGIEADQLSLVRNGQVQVLRLP